LAKSSCGSSPLWLQHKIGKNKIASNLLEKDGDYVTCLGREHFKRLMFSTIVALVTYPYKKPFYWHFSLFLCFAP
jgi:hypothetical protein